MTALFGAQLHSRPVDNIKTKTPAPKGMQRLGLEKDRDGLLYIPNHLDATRPAPLIMMLHGAGGRAEHSMSYVGFQKFADENGALLVAPESRAVTWDVIVGNYGPDVRFIDQVLEHLFSQFSIDLNHLALAGFSDGASYALSLGLANGDLFSHILAFSPGFMAPPERRDSPPVFISHGLHDAVLAIDYCSRRIVPRLKDMDYTVTYREFNGEHVIPDFISDEALQWFLGKAPLNQAQAATPNRQPRLEGP